MKAIVIKQPRATLVAKGVKTIETRPSPPNGPMRPDGVRGLPGCSLERGERIAIVAGRHESYVAAESAWERFFKLEDEEGDPETGITLPHHAVVCTVTVDDALPIHGPADQPEHRFARRRARLLHDPAYGGGGPALSLWPGDGAWQFMSDQLPLGDFTPGRWGLLLSDPQPPTKPCGTCGGSGLSALCGRTDAGSDGPCVMRSGHTTGPCYGENDVASEWNPALPCVACCACPCGSTLDGTECPWCHATTTPCRVPADPIPCTGKQGVFELPADIAERLS